MRLFRMARLENVEAKEEENDTSQQNHRFGQQIFEYENESKLL